MTLRTQGRRAGITLVEILVVIGIIALLMGLLLPAIMRAIEAGPRADTAARLTTVSAVLSTFNNDQRFGQTKCLPAGQVDLNPTLANGTPNPNFQKVIGPFRLRNSYTATTTPDLNSFEAQYIARVFGSRVNLADLGNPAFPGNDTSPPIQLDGNQCLVFFLGGIPEPDAAGNVTFTGFSNDPQRPFTRRASASEERKSMDLDLNRKRYALPPSNYVEPRFAWLIDAHGQPFAYFSAYNGRPGKMSGWNPFATGLQPYHVSGKFENETSFQIISAGNDEKFGPGGDWRISATTPDGRDDQANFSKEMLGSGPQQ